MRHVGAERVIEVEPSNILTNMMTKTWSNGICDEDVALNKKRSFFGPQGDVDAIYYRELPSAEADDEIDNNSTSQHPPPTSSTTVLDTMAISSEPPTERNVVPPTALTSPQHGSVDKLSETDVPAELQVLLIVATKLKKPSSDIGIEKTITSLVSGRSTLSNELIGDLDAEFPRLLPDKPEDMTLKELSQALQTGSNGRMGKTTTSLVAKMISTKFPGDYSQSKVRQHLESRWGLGTMRQDAVLLICASKPQPDSRFSNALATESFLAEVATQYFTQEGLPLPSQSGNSTGGSSSNEAVVIDSRALQAIDEKNTALLKNLSETINAHLGGSSQDSIDEQNITMLDKEVDTATADADLWLTEHGDHYAEGIQPKFDPKRLRTYDSYWNWNAQDITKFCTLIREARPENNVALQELFSNIVNRACGRSLSQLKHLSTLSQKEGVESKHLTKSLWLLLEASREAVHCDPVFIDTTPDLAPVTAIDHSGNIVASEVKRKKWEPSSRQTPTPPSPSSDSTLKSDSASRPVELHKMQTDYPYPVGMFSDGTSEYSEGLTMMYQRDLKSVRESGCSFAGKNILLTGAGRNSIGLSVLRDLLVGGARVTVTSSSFSPKVAQMFQDQYAQCGAKGSVLRVVPFNQGSKQDVLKLVDWIYKGDNSSSTAWDWDLDYIIPFAAISENGRDLENIDSKAEIAHRLMFTNLLRILGEIARHKRERGIVTRPATVVLPLSPNHGLMGSDGLYSESKRSLEALLGKWFSESWDPYLSLLGVIIGWTRGTSLMDENDSVAQAVESIGVKTFSTDEMAANIVTLLGGSINAECQLAPLVVNLGGGLGNVKDFQSQLTGFRRAIQQHAVIQKALASELECDQRVVDGEQTTEISKALASGSQQSLLQPRANIKLPLPHLPDFDTELSTLAQSLEGMVDLSRVVVITGFSELGPHGNARTRWDMEVNGSFSLEGSIEMAWMMGLIRFQKSRIGKDGKAVAGWVDATTGAAVEESDVYKKYMSRILEHTGLRTIEPDICDNSYNPQSKDGLQELVLQRDQPPFETTREVAENLQRKHGSKAVITTPKEKTDNDDVFLVQLKAGATVMAPTASRFNRTVAGQIPTGWSAKHYGISDDIIEQVDPVTLFSLVCTVEALLCSGIVDAYELYEHIHVSELGNCLGSSMGGLSSLRKMHRDRFTDKQVKSDVLQETFINTTGAWINMLLTSSAGPIRTPVGACATSLESLDTASDLIMTGKAKIVLAGGVEDFVEDVSYEFGSMKATCDTSAESAAGRSPSEMSRPMTSTRSGFVEAQGAGVQVVTSAELALKMGLPIFGILAYSNMSADGAGRSVPAPGKGVLTNARESLPVTPPSPTSQIPSSSMIQTLPSTSSPNAASIGDDDRFPWPQLNLDYRRNMLQRRKKQIEDFVQDSMDELEDSIAVIKATAASRGEKADENNQLLEGDLDLYRKEHITAILEGADSQRAEAAFVLGNQFWRNDAQKQRISPLRGSLATWGLTIDDITVASLHGTSTVKNDLNEPLVIQQQMRHLGRQEGNLLACVCQKWLTGHSKGAAGAWMVNSALQMMSSGRIPGNRNADNIEKELRQHQHLFFPNKTIDVQDTTAHTATTDTSTREGIVKACSVTSFGFGQKGAQAILVHPRYLFATISKERYQGYSGKRLDRWRKACQAFSSSLVEQSMVSSRIKDDKPYKKQDEMKVLLNPLSRY